MPTFIRTYPYLAYSLGMAAVLAGALVLCSARRRRAALFVAMAGMPCAFLENLTIPGYWNPRRVFVCLGVGPEDLLFCFATGGASWLLATWGLRGGIVFDYRLGESLRRFLACVLLGLVPMILLKALGTGVSTAVIGSMAFFTVAMLCLEGQFWLVLVSGAVGFCLTYFLTVKLLFTAMPEALREWTLGNLWGPMVWGVPLDEIAWSAAFGAAWPAAMCYMLGARRRGRPGSTGRRPPDWVTAAVRHLLGSDNVTR
jgi:hypothetical protein